MRFSLAAQLRARAVPGGQLVMAPGPRLTSMTPPDLSFIVGPQRQWPLDGVNAPRADPWVVPPD